jgi:hypothetical protein
LGEATIQDDPALRLIIPGMKLLPVALEQRVPGHFLINESMERDEVVRHEGVVIRSQFHPILRVEAQIAILNDLRMRICRASIG